MKDDRIVPKTVTEKTPCSECGTDPSKAVDLVFWVYNGKVMCANCINDVLYSIVGNLQAEIGKLMKDHAKHVQQLLTSAQESSEAVWKRCQRLEEKLEEYEGKKRN